MTKKEIKSFRREMKLRPYKQAFRILKQFGASLLIAGVAVVGGWVAIVGLLSI